MAKIRAKRKIGGSSKVRQTGTSNKKKDKRVQAKKPGKRKSATGRTYYERRKNRSDKPGSLLGVVNIVGRCYVLTEWDGKGSGFKTGIFNSKKEAVNDARCTLTAVEARKKHGSLFLRTIDVKCSTIDSYSSLSAYKRGAAPLATYVYYC